VEVVVPDLGDFADVEVIEVLVKPGDSVAAEQGLITLETDKATMDIPSPVAGKITALKVKTGDRVSAGSVIATLDTGESDAAAGPAIDTRPENDRTVRQPRLARSAPAAKSGASIEPLIVAVPDLGDFSGVEIIEILVKPGDEVAAEQGLVTLETEKASMDVPSPQAGRVLEVKAAVGDKVSAGDALLVLQPSGAAVAAAPAAPPAPPSAASPPPRPTTPAWPHRFADADVVRRSMRCRYAARELGVDLGRVRGSPGPGTGDDGKRSSKKSYGGARPARCPRCRPSTSRSSAASRRSRCRGSRRSRGRGCTRAGSTCRTSRSTTRPTSRSSKRGAWP
jgi:pyruvate dehydrogenase E2 component (dihydrolipoamide acetyltransferase)